MDRDIALVGLPLFNHFNNKEVYVQYKDPPKISFVHMNALEIALLNDSDLELVTASGQK